MLVDLRARNITGDVAAEALEKAGLAVNKNMIPFDPRPPEAPSGLRLSSNAGTTRGFGVAEFQAIAGWIDRVLQNPGDDQAIAAVGVTKCGPCARETPSIDADAIGAASERAAPSSCRFLNSVHSSVAFR